DQILGEAVVKQPKTGAQYGFRGALPASAYAPGNTEPRRPVRMIVDCVLRFKAQAAAQREVGTHLPVLLHVQSRVHHCDGYTGSAAAGGCIDGILAWSSTVVIPEAREGICAIESGAGHIDFVNCPQAPTEFQELLTQRHRRVILQFVVILVVGLRSRTAASTCETPKNIDAYGRAKRCLPAVVAQVLEASLIDGLRSQDLRIADLHRVFGGCGVVASFRQYGRTDTGVLLSVTVKLVAGGERIVRADLVVDTRTDVGAGTRVGNALVHAEVGRVHDCDFINVAPLHLEKERCLLVDRPADISHVFHGVV